MQAETETKAKDMAAETTRGSLSAADSGDMGAVESFGLGSSTSNASAADDAILRAQGHTAAMPRAFSLISSMGLMFWYVFLR